MKNRRSSSTSATGFFVGGVVIDEGDTGADLPALIVEALDQTAAEYVVSASIGGEQTAIADRCPRVPAEDSCYVLLFAPALRSNFPNWHQGTTGEILAAYRSGGFRSVAQVRPESVLTPIEDLSMLPDRSESKDSRDR